MKAKNIIWLVCGLLTGAVAGWLYQHFAGCANGSCAITSSPVAAAMYGSAVGGFIALNVKKGTRHE